MEKVNRDVQGQDVLNRNWDIWEGREVVSTQWRGGGD